jgi:hypothetical protein
MKDAHAKGWTFGYDEWESDLERLSTSPYWLVLITESIDTKARMTERPLFVAFGFREREAFSHCFVGQSPTRAAERFGVAYILGRVTPC